MNEIDGPAIAREKAAFLSEHSNRRCLPPITEVYVEQDRLKVTVSPANRAVWDKWCSVLSLDAAKAVWERGMVTARGSWNGTDVVLTGIGIDWWWSQ